MWPTNPRSTCAVRSGRCWLAAFVVVVTLSAACADDAEVHLGDASPRDANDGEIGGDFGPGDAGDGADGSDVDSSGDLPEERFPCAVAGDPLERIALEPVLTATDPELINLPTQLVLVPDGSGRYALVTQSGVISIAPSLAVDAALEPWSDFNELGELGLDQLARPPDNGPETGLISVAFHPSFADNALMYATYTRWVGEQLQLVLAELDVVDESGAPDPAGSPDLAHRREVLVVDQPAQDHNAGLVRFGPDDYLYLALGDGGRQRDPFGNGQNTGNLLATIVRIDVDDPDGSREYSVPADNPFVGDPEARDEIYAYGFRNPWRYDWDADGRLWVADVGQSEWEEIDIVETGGNYGWSAMEGLHCFSGECDPSAFQLPVFEYGHDEGLSIVGGFDYRGELHPGLIGVFVFGDFVNGQIWGLREVDPGAWERLNIVESTGLNITSFAEDDNGELYVMDWHGGGIFRLGLSQAFAWREQVSDTHCFADLETRELAEGVLSYSVNSPLWSDGAGKERALYLPPGGRIGFAESGAWELPAGSILIKTFLLGERPLETRFLTLDDDGRWHGATYRWPGDGDDAFLLDAELEERIGEQTWTYPSRADCDTCHTEASGHTLGLQTAQLNRLHDVFGDGSAVNIIDALAADGRFEGNVSAAAELPSFPDPADSESPIDERSRSYLHSNCANCHLPGGPTLADFDTRFDTPLLETGLCDAEPLRGDLDIEGARLLAPGSPELSLILARMAITGTNAMPPLGRGVVDEMGTSLIEAWIEQIESCEPD